MLFVCFSTLIILFSTRLRAAFPTFASEVFINLISITLNLMEIMLDLSSWFRDGVHRRALLSFLCLLLTMGLQAQEVKISGHVRSASDGEPLVGVSVALAGRAGGSVTDIDGNYTLAARVGDRLVFSYVGFMPAEAKVVSGKTVYDMALREDEIGRATCRERVE